MLGRLKPIFSIRANKVVGLIPKSSAAPAVPLILQPVFWSTMERLSRSRRRISASVTYPASLCRHAELPGLSPTTLFARIQKIGLKRPALNECVES